MFIHSTSHSWFLALEDSSSLTSCSSRSTSTILQQIASYIEGRLTELHQLWLIEMQAVRFSTVWYQPLGLWEWARGKLLQENSTGGMQHTRRRSPPPLGPILSQAAF